MSKSHMPEGAGQATPEKRKPADKAGFHKDQAEQSGAIVRDIDAECKAFATLQARAALTGIQLHKLADGSFTVSRWGMYRELPTLREVGDMLRRMGAVS